MVMHPDLPDVIPIFPLAGALLLPRSQMPLHLFEPRYLAMLDDALKTDSRLIGMVQPSGEDTLHSIGCVGRVTSMTEIDGGRYAITLTGISRFRFLDEVEGFTPYRRARVEWDEFEGDLGDEQDDPDLDRGVFLDLLERFFDDQDLSTDWESLKDADTELLINSLSMLCPFKPEERQALLESPTLVDRREILEMLIEYALRSGDDDMQVMQ